MGLFTYTPIAVSSLRVGGISNPQGNITIEDGLTWIKDHADVCVAAKKPCIFEEYGLVTEEKCDKMTGWQKQSLQSKGMAADMYWQYGDTISTGKTSDDKNTVYRGTKNWDCLITDHGKRITRQNKAL
jgi:mannan endo-1,4-beta-mannosidase